MSEGAAQRIFILDEVVVKPGLARAFNDIYRDEYMPAARRRDMEPEGAWHSPPGFLPDEIAVTFYYLWSVDGVAGWWKMRLSRTADGGDERFEKLGWWQKVEEMIVERKRVMLTRAE